MVQLNSSAEKSSKSRQSVIALERRRSPKKLPKFEMVDVTSRIIPMVVSKEPTNSEMGTFKLSFCKESLLLPDEAAAERVLETKIKAANKEMKGKGVENLDIVEGK